jgi:hypothetical protein
LLRCTTGPSKEFGFTKLDIPLRKRAFVRITELVYSREVERRLIEQRDEPRKVHVPPDTGVWVVGASKIRMLREHRRGS